MDTQFFKRLEVLAKSAKKSISVVSNVRCRELDSILSRLERVIATWNPVELYTIAGAEAVKSQFLAEFLAGKSVKSPEFSYDHGLLLGVLESQSALELLSHELRALTSRGWSIFRSAQLNCLYALAEQLMADCLTTVDMVSGILDRNDGRTKAAMLAKYGDLEPETVDAAWYQFEDLASKETAGEKPVEGQILTQAEANWLLAQKFGALEIREAFDWALEKYGWRGEYRVLISSMATSIDVRDRSSHGRPVIEIPENREIDGRQLLSLLGHEVSSHVRQSLNGIKMLHGIGGGVLKFDDETLYEGLAKVADAKFAREFFGEVNPMPAPFYVLAMKEALQAKSFVQVFRFVFELQRDLGKSAEAAAKAAWLPTYRVFRGITNTENPDGYAMTKDKAYLEGFLLAKKLQELNLDKWLETAIVPVSCLEFLVRFQPEVPYPALDLARQYWEEELKPRMKRNF